MLAVSLLLLFTFPKVQSGSVFCPDTADIIADELFNGCLGVKFNWLFAVFDNLPSLLRFAVWMRCESGVCPADLQAHRLYCSYTIIQNITDMPSPADTLDWCCFDHQRCYQELKERGCKQSPPTATNYTCSHLTNNTCDSVDLCEQGFCLCDQEAIACITYNSHSLIQNQLDKLDLNISGLYNDTFIRDAVNRTDLYTTLNGTVDNFTEDFLPSNNSLMNQTHKPWNSGMDMNQTHNPWNSGMDMNQTHHPWNSEMDINQTHNPWNSGIDQTELFTTLNETLGNITEGLLQTNDTLMNQTHSPGNSVIPPTENLDVTPVTKLQNPLEGQAYTPQPEPMTAHTYPVDNWMYTLPQEMEKDEDGEFQTDLYPDIITKAFGNLTTSDKESHERSNEDEDQVITEISSDEKKEHNDEKDTIKEQPEHGLSMLLSSISSPTATKQITTHPITVFVTAEQKTETLSTSIDQLSKEDKDESREKESREKELKTEELQVTVLKNTDHDQPKFTAIPTPANPHAQSITQVRHEESREDDAQSGEVDQQMSAEIQDSVSSFTTAANVHTPKTSDSILKDKVVKVNASSQMTLTVAPKTTNFPVRHYTSHRPTTHTTPRSSTLQTTHTAHPKFTKTTHLPHTSHTQSTHTQHKPSMTIHQRPVSISRPLITLNHKPVPSPIPTHPPRFPYTSKPTTTLPSSSPTTEGRSEEEEEKKYEELKKELLDSSQESEPDKPLQLQRRSMPLLAWSLLEAAGLFDIQQHAQSKECSMTFTQYSSAGVNIREFTALGEMLHCLTGRCPQEYQNYGCYCGQQGSGIPQDRMDQCCFFHQCCLEHLELLGCRRNRKANVEVVCHNGKPTCLGVSLCDRLQCVCDRTTAECMAASQFNHSITPQCSGLRPHCIRRLRPTTQPTKDDSSQESSETGNSNPETHKKPQQLLHTLGKPGPVKPVGGTFEKDFKNEEKPEAEEQNEEKEEKGKEEEEEV